MTSKREVIIIGNVVFVVNEVSFTFALPLACTVIKGKKFMIIGRSSVTSQALRAAVVVELREMLLVWQGNAAQLLV